MMVGHAVTLNIDRPLVENRHLRLEVKDLTVLTPDGIKALDHVSFEAYGGEILGIAGISAADRRSCWRPSPGFSPPSPAPSDLPPARSRRAHRRAACAGEPQRRELLGKTPRQIHNIGVSMAFVPEDRLGMGLVGSMGMADNMMLKSYRAGRGPFVHRNPPRQLAEQVKAELDVLTPSINTPVRRSLRRATCRGAGGPRDLPEPLVLMTAYAVRGWTSTPSYTIYNLLTEQKMKGVAVVYVGEDLDVLLELCDRILVLCGGQVSVLWTAAAQQKRKWVC